MANIIDELIVQLKLDGTFAKNEADKIARDAEKAAKDTGKAFKKAGDKAKEAGEKAKAGAKEAESGWSSFATGLKDKLLGVTAAFAALYGIQNTFSSYLSTADAMGKFSDSIGQNIEDVHAWSEAVIRSGGSAEGFQGSIKSLSAQLSKMSTTGNSRAGKILSSVGIDAGGVGNARKSLDVMMDIADVMQKMTKEEAMGFGASLGIDSGTIMLLQQGRDAVGDLVLKQKQLGVYTKEDARVTAEFNDAIANSKQSFMGFASIIFRMITPAFTGLVDELTTFINYLRQHEVAVQSFFIMLATILTARLIPAFMSFFATLLRNPMAWVIAAIAGLALALEDLYVWANGGESAFGEFWEAVFGSKDEALAFFEDLKDLGKDLLDVVKDLVDAYKELKQWWNGFKDTGGSVELLASADGSLMDLERQDVLSDKFQQIYADNMKLKPETAENIAESMGETYKNAMFNVEDEATEAGERAAQNMTNAFFEPFENFMTEWNNEGFFAAFASESEETAEAVAGLTDNVEELNDISDTTNTAVNNHLKEQQGNISQTGSYIDGLIGKFENLRQTILSMPTYNPIYGSMPGLAVSGGGGISNNYNNRNSDTRVGTVNVYTQATDANGIAGSIGGAMTSRFNAFQAEGAY